MQFGLFSYSSKALQKFQVTLLHMFLYFASIHMCLFNAVQLFDTVIRIKSMVALYGYLMVTI